MNSKYDFYYEKVKTENVNSSRLNSKYYFKITVDPPASIIIIKAYCETIIKEPIRFKNCPCHFDSKEKYIKLDDEGRKWKYIQEVPATG